MYRPTKSSSVQRVGSNRFQLVLGEGNVPEGNGVVWGAVRRKGRQQGTDTQELSWEQAPLESFSWALSLECMNSVFSLFILLLMIQILEMGGGSTWHSLDNISSLQLEEKGCPR